MRVRARACLTLGTLGLSLAGAAFCLCGDVAQAKPGDWATYNRDLGGTRYAPLRQITRQNVGALQPAWRYKLAAGESKLDRPSQATPLVIGDTVYLPAGTRVVALDALTGVERWSHRFASGRVSHRGVSYWPGDGHSEPRIFVTVGSRLVALEASTGHPARGFGGDGEVEIGVPYWSPPTIFDNVVVLGANVPELPQGPPGDTRAYDARDGTKLWTFHTVPREGEPGNETWGDGWRERSGANVWAFSMSVDQRHGLLYMPISGPATNYWGGDRPGDNLYANSVVAVDVRTGRYRWHFQTVHHDLWDTDLPAAPALVDIKRGGRIVPALIQVTKSGFVFILDRLTGQPVFGVEERPVPAGDVPGEHYSPTQPIPVLPRPVTRTQFTRADLVGPEDTTPEHAAAVADLWTRSGGLLHQGPYTGSVDGPGPYYSLGADLGEATGANRTPGIKPPWGVLIAINANSGATVWEVPLGLSEELPEGKQLTGRSLNAGPMVTASGLLFIGATLDRRFRAFDATTGEEVWSYRLEAPADANPITYLGSDGRQYVAVIARDTLVSFALADP